MNEYLKQLHEKIIEHHQRVESNYPQGLSCKNGCSRCCYVDLSIFSVEAQFIRDWFKALSSNKKAELKVLWEKEISYQKNFFDQNVASCPFLKNESCSIYEARPVICRTQGLPLKFNDEGEDCVDACPLNFNDDEIVMGDCLDLDRLNLILSTLQHQRGDEERVNLKELLNELKRIV